MDASVGLTFSLKLFQRYKRSGTLQAEIRHVPGIQGMCTAYVQLTAGSVTACYLENKQKQRVPFAIDELCRIDAERGPFEWTFQPQASSRAHAAGSSSAPPSFDSLAGSASLDAAIPRVVAQLSWERFNHWTLEQKLLLQDVWQNIDGKRTVRDIKTTLSYPPQMVNDILHILLNLRLIVLAS